MFLGLQWREAGASHLTWIIKKERMPLLFCRVSAQSVGKVETGDTVLKGAGNENKLMLQMKEVWCWDWVTNGRGSVGRGLRMIWNGSLEALQQRIDISVWLRNQWLKSLWVSAAALLGLSLFFLGEDMLYVRLCQIIHSQASLHLNALMFTCLFTWTKLLRLWGRVLVWVSTCMHTNVNIEMWV